MRIQIASQSSQNRMWTGQGRLHIEAVRRDDVGVAATRAASPAVVEPEPDMAERTRPLDDVSDRSLRFFPNQLPDLSERPSGSVSLQRRNRAAWRRLLPSRWP